MLSDQEFEALMAKMLGCTDKFPGPENSMACSCAVDIELSQLPKPAEIDAYCTQYGQKYTALEKAPQAQKMLTAIEAAAADLPYPSAVLFGFGLPCAVPALKAKDGGAMKQCLCSVAWVGKELWHRHANAGALSEAMTASAERLRKAGACLASAAL